MQAETIQIQAEVLVYKSWLQSVDHFLWRFITVSRLLLNHSDDNRFHLCADIRLSRPQRFRHFQLMRHQLPGNRRNLKGELSSKQKIGRHTERIDVSPYIDIV